MDKDLEGTIATEIGDLSSLEVLILRKHILILRYVCIHHVYNESLMYCLLDSRGLEPIPILVYHTIISENILKKRSLLLYHK